MKPHPTPHARRALPALLALAALAASLALPGPGLRAEPAAPQGWGHIRTSLLFTSDDVEQLLSSPADREATLAYFAPLRLTKVYLENASDDPASVAALRAVAEDLRARGLRVSGVVVPSNRGPLAYNDPADMALLEARVRILAQVMDEIIVDDWLFTTSTDPKSVGERGAQSWADYRSRLVAEESKRHLIDAAKRVNPRVQVIIKYPNWYEGHRQNGYDAALQTPQFDGVSVGIETRQRATDEQHIPIYSGYVFQRWIGGDAGGKWRSAWLDNFGMQGDPEDFLAEVWQAVLARAPEIIFWCAGQLHPPVKASDVYPSLCQAMPGFDRLAGLLDGPARGVPIHLPLGSVGEYNIFGYLGMAGIPLDPTTAFPAEAKDAIFTRHSLRDPGLGAELEARVRSGREVFVSWSLMRELERQGAELGRSLNVIDGEGTVTSSTFRVHYRPWDARLVAADRPFTFPKLQVSTWPYVRDVALVREDGDFGVMLSAAYLGGTVDVLNMPDNSYDLLRLPEPVLDAIREHLSAEIGVRLLGPGGVALYPFGSRQFVLLDMNDAPAAVSLRFPDGTPEAGWTERMRGAPLATRVVTSGREPYARRETEVGLTLKPFEPVLIERP
jgi:hypothetical protein